MKIEFQLEFKFTLSVLREQKNWMITKMDLPHIYLIIYLICDKKLLKIGRSIWTLLWWDMLEGMEKSISPDLGYIIVLGQILE